MAKLWLENIYIPLILKYMQTSNYMLYFQLIQEKKHWQWYIRQQCNQQQKKQQQQIHRRQQ